MASIVGSWNIRATWSFGPGAGKEFNIGEVAFNADGTWTEDDDNSGRWLQVGDQVVWNVTVPSGVLVYSANIQPGQVLPHEASMTGIMGWLRQGSNHGGFRAKRLFDELVVASVGVPENNSDPLLGPVADRSDDRQLSCPAHVLTLRPRVCRRRRARGTRRRCKAPSASPVRVTNRVTRAGE
ncbi:hypothetical protein [Kribbella sp. NPDC049227]|uniref:hypothetical protein n=1 Tax=Kribbella sp. NPDC049227 TaxID=3364113 RepID=UPI00371ECBEE